MTETAIAGIAWDVDGTLVDSEPTHHQGMIEVCLALGIDLRRDPPDFVFNMVESFLATDRLAFLATAIYETARVPFACAARYVSPELLKQLKPGGRLIVPIGQPFKKGQVLYVFTKDKDGKVHSRKDMGVFFIPMTGKIMEKKS